MTAYFVDAQARWIALVRGPVVLMLPRTTAALADLWEALAATDQVGAVLGRLTREGLADVPPFAMVAGADRRRVIVRGGFRVVAAGEEITASGVSTWVERIVPADAPYEVIAPFASVADDADVWPVGEGMVPASIVRSDDVRLDPAAETPIAVADEGLAPQPADASADPSAAASAEAPAAPITAETTVVQEDTMVPLADDAVDAVDATDAVDDATIIVAKPSSVKASAPLAPAAAHGAGGGDHDGLTIAVTALQELRGRAKRTAPVEGSESGPRGGADAPARPQTVTLRLPGGGEEPLTGEIVLGRSPSVSRATGTVLPRLVTVGAGDPDISRSHVRIGLEGGTVVVTDLHSRNGTSVVQPGRAPVKLRAGEPTPVLVGTVVDLGGGCEVAVVAD
jgi:hypothetical protein